jgi:putative transposase
VKYAFIKHEAVRYGIAPLCKVLGVSRSGYYDWQQRDISPREKANQRLLKLITHEFNTHKGRYGSPRIHAALKRQGEQASKSRIERLMKRNGLIALRAKRHKRVYVQRAQQQPAPNHLARMFRARKPNEKWVSDITFIPTRQGYLYLATVVDLFSRAIVGWAMSARINGQLVLDALDMAVQQRGSPQGVLVHSDQGSQYTAEAYRKQLKDNAMVCSMSRKGECLDNAVAESFFHTLKEELVKDACFTSLREAKQAIFKYIEIYYNRQRLHSTLGYETPMAYERINAA